MIRKNNWDTYHKGDIDQERHKQRIKKAIRENLSEIIGEETLILGNKDEKLGINIKSLKEFKITFNDSNSEGVGMGSGKPKPGDIISKGKGQSGSGTGEGAGESPGEDWFENQVDLDEIQEELFAQMTLPDLKEKKQKNRITIQDIEYKDIRKNGIQSNIHKKRTLLNSIKRGENTTYPIIKKEDVVYKTWDYIEKPQTNAVVFALMDVSGSMGIMEKYIARSFYFWVKRFLETKYDNVEIVYIGHHTEAKQYTEEKFFSKGESGGTICSSAFRLMKQLMDEKYSPDDYNIFGFHVSDGDNLTSDNQRCINLLQEMSKDIVTFNYLEVNQYNRSSTLGTAYQNMVMNNFRSFQVRKKSDIYDALKIFFSKEKE